MATDTDTPSEKDARIDYHTVRYGDIEVYWLPELEGGGISFGQDFLPVVEHLFGHVGRVFEVCAGPSFIGFSLLAHGLCDSLVLSDINPVAVEAARETVRRNGLEDRVTVYQSDGFTEMPAHERCDLLVASPPFFLDSRVPFLRDPWAGPTTSLRSLDPGLRFHRDLYENLARFLNQGGSALVHGCTAATPPEVFLPMIEAGGLQHIRTFWYTEHHFPFIYYMWSKNALPSMLFDQADPKAVRINLRDSPQEPVPLSAQAVYVFQLCNQTTKSLAAKFKLWDEDSSYPERSLTEIPEGGQLELPQMVLRPGTKMVIEDEQSGAVLAHLHVPK